MAEDTGSGKCCSTGHGDGRGLAWMVGFTSVLRSRMGWNMGSVSIIFHFLQNRCGIRIGP